MALSKEIVISGIQLDSDKTVFVNKDTVVKEDGVQISSKRFRQVIVSSMTDKNADGSFTTTNTDISSEPQEVQDICNAAWTNDVKAAYIAKCKTNLGG
jgi:hypothetical protein|tara:strand:- start:155 stop:448 length:294 start_codon:yes stop_codon:yes gene_type:complete